MLNKAGRLLLSSTSLVTGLGLASGAHAQDVLETVVVTAEKNAATDIQKTAVSISAITPDSVKGAGSIQLYQLVQGLPSVDILKSGSNARRVVFLRGISDTTLLTDGMPAAPFNAPPFDGQLGSSLDVGRVEVLRGPQGTLYGAGAFGGVVNIITNDPTEKYSIDSTFRVGSNNLIAGEVVANVPLTDDMFLRLALGVQKATGYVRPQATNGDDAALFRAKLLYRPTETFRLMLTASESDDVINGGNETLPVRTKNANFASPAFGGFNPCGGDPVLNLSNDPWHSFKKLYQAYPCTAPVSTNVPGFSTIPQTGVCTNTARWEEWGARVALDAEWDLGFGVATLLSQWAANSVPAGAYSNRPFRSQFSQGQWNPLVPNESNELRLASPADSSWKWVVGSYLAFDNLDANTWRRYTVNTANPFGQDGETKQHNVTKSAFASVTVPVTDRFRVSGGLRYNMESKAQSILNINMATGVSSKPANTDFNYHQLTYKVGADFDITQDSLIYASVGTGFKSGVTTGDLFCVGKTSGYFYHPADGSNAVLPRPTGGCQTTTTVIAGGPAFTEATVATAVTNALASDTLKAYEVGSKNRFLDNKIQINVSAYYYKFPHLSSQIGHLNSDNSNTPQIAEVTGTKAYGGELESSFLITSNDRIDFNLGYNPTEIGQNSLEQPVCYNFGVSTHPSINTSNAANLALCNAKNLAANPLSVNWVRFRDAISDNHPLFQAPRWNGSASYQHIFDLDDGATVTARATLRFSSSYSAGANYFIDGFQEAFHQTDASLIYDAPNGRWSLQAWVKNIENNAIIEQAEQVGTGLDPTYVGYAPPRMFGLTFHMALDGGLLSGN